MENVKNDLKNSIENLTSGIDAIGELLREETANSVIDKLLDRKNDFEQRIADKKVQLAILEKLDSFETELRMIRGQINQSAADYWPLVEIEGDTSEFWKTMGEFEQQTREQIDRIVRQCNYGG